MAKIIFRDWAVLKIPAIFNVNKSEGPALVLKKGFLYHVY